MNSQTRRAGRPWFAAVVLMLVSVLSVFMFGQQGSRIPGNSPRVPILSFGSQQAPPEVPGLVDDWSHHHLVFSNPGTEDDAIREGRYDEWRRTVTDLRYVMQQLKRHAPAQGPAAAYTDRLNETPQAGEATRGGEPGLALWQDFLKPRKEPKPPAIHGDWSMDMGAGATVGADQYPAKYTINVTGAPSCADFVVFNTGVAGSSSQPTIVAYNNIYATTCTGSVPSVYWAYNTSSGSNTAILTSVVLSGDGSQIAFVENEPGGENLASAMLVLLKWQANDGTVASPVAPAAVSASAYRTCAAPCMTTLTFTGTLVSSYYSAPYYDYGDDILYVGDDGPSGGEGQLHKFTGVFNGTPAEVTSSPWPIALGEDDYELSSPVYDSSSGNVFVGDLYGYFHSVKASTGAVVGTSGRLDDNQGLRDGPLVDSVAAMAYVFVGDNASGDSAVRQFATTFTSGSGTQKTLGAGSLALYSGTFDNAYYTASSGSSPTGSLYVCGKSGGDPTLYRIPISANAMGTVKAGPALATANTPCSPLTEIYNAGASGGPFDWIYASVQASGSPAGCSAGGCIINYIVTAWQAANAYSLGQEILDTNLNIQKVTTAGTSGSSAPTWKTSGTTTDGTVTWTYQGSMSAVGSTATAEAGGTSGMVIDNTSSIAGASQIYFSTLGSATCSTSGGTGGCAIQAAQSAP